jgi:hypothetical protein
MTGGTVTGEVDSAGVRGGDAPSRWSNRIARIIPALTLAGILASLLFHLGGWLVAALVTVGGAQAGGAGLDADESVGVAIVSEYELARLQEAALPEDAPAVAEVEVSLADAIEPLDIPTDDALASLDASAADVGLSLGAGDLAGADLGTGGSGGGAASFFGVEARGTRFAYIVDVSGSMSIGGRIETLRQELSQSILALLENARFFIALFSSSATPLGGRREWVEASDAGKRWARKSLEMIQPGGGTDPLPAFIMVYSMRPRPDAIYFMTDGEFDESIGLQIIRLSEENRIPIHCITFVSRGAEQMMRQIAASSGGTYTHVPGRGG